MKLNKYQKNTLIAVSIATIILLLSFSTFLNPLALTGASTLSLSQVSLQSFNNYLNGQAWLLTFSAGGLGQSYFGTITPSDVDAKTADSTTTQYPFTVAVEYDDQECQYPITGASQSIPIYSIDQKTYTYIPLVSPCDIATGASKAGVSQSSIIGAFKPSGSFTCHIVYITGQSPVGTMGNGNVNAPYTITVNANGKTASKTINPLQGTSQGAIGDFA